MSTATTLPHNSPSLFSLATSELSQDAFIAWYLSWADPQFKETNHNLHNSAVQFARALINLQSDAPQEITKVETGRQLNHIDVWAKINDEFFIIIEDKTGTGRHSNQLQRYKSSAEQLCQEHKMKLICVYLKTQSEALQISEGIRKEGFDVFMRKDLLKVMDSIKVKNDIFEDFRTHLHNIENNENDYLTQPLINWQYYHWKGFYVDLDRQKIISNWGYVPNQTGGFWGAFFDGSCYKNHPVYMQIEQGKLCFKVGEVNENRASTRNDLHGNLMKNQRDELPIFKPRRFGSGKYMTVAETGTDDWAVQENGKIRLKQTVEKLKAYHEWLKSLF